MLVDITKKYRMSQMSNPKKNKDRTVLVVDDEVLVLEIVEAFIEQLGHKVLLATSAEPRFPR